MIQNEASQRPSGVLGRVPAALRPGTSLRLPSTRLPTMTDTRELLERCLGRLALAKQRVQIGWCQKDFSRTKRGRRCYSSSPAAVCWCTLGAIGADTPFPDEDADLIIQLQKTLVVSGIGEEFSGDIADWNDMEGRTLADVLELFENAEKRTQLALDTMTNNQGSAV